MEEEVFACQHCGLSVEHGRVQPETLGVGIDEHDVGMQGCASLDLGEEAQVRLDGVGRAPGACLVVGADPEVLEEGLVGGGADGGVGRVGDVAVVVEPLLANRDIR